MQYLKKWTLYVVIVGTLCGNSSEGSSMEANDTVLSSWPPLYALDAWAHCQRPEDVYCIVDAVLVAATPSPLLEQIQEYSSKNLKHYNRTLVHRGVCVTQCGGRSPDTWRDAAGDCLNNSLAQYGLEATVQAVHWCNDRRLEPISFSARAFLVVCAILLALILVATGLHALGDRFGKCFGNKYIFAFSLKRNWQTLIYNDKTPKKDDRTRDLSCIEGIRMLQCRRILDSQIMHHGNETVAARLLQDYSNVFMYMTKHDNPAEFLLALLALLRFIGTISVVLTHVTVVHVFAFIDNPDFIENLYEHISTKAAFNTPLWIQVFISISGFLSAYYLLIYTEKAKFTLAKCIMSFVHRYMRLTPVSVFALWFTMSWFPRMSAGPQWAWLVAQEARYCSERWWYHALYVHNYLDLGELCMGHTWYLAVDMQLHVIGMLLLLILLRWRKAVVPVLAMILITTVLATGLLVYFTNLTPIITAQAPEVVRNMFKGSLVLKLIYLPVWVHLAGYALGVATAYIHYHNQNNGYKLRENKWFSLAFHLSLVVAGAVCVSGTAFLSDVPLPRWLSAIYAALDKTLVALCFNVFLLGCLSRCRSVLRDVLSWNGWHALGRLSYSVFIIHFIVLRFTVANNTQIIHMTVYSMISLLIVGTVLTYLISVPVYLVIEMPFTQFWKALIGLDSCKKNDAQAQEIHNKIDLVTKGDRRSRHIVV